MTVFEDSKFWLHASVIFAVCCCILFYARMFIQDIDTVSMADNTLALASLSYLCHLKHCKKLRESNGE